MTDTDFSNARWRKASVSGDGGCVEVARAGGAVAVRDSKAHGTGPVLVFSEREWAAFLDCARSGEFDLDGLAS